MRTKRFIITAVIAFLLVGFIYETTKRDTSIQNLSESRYGVVNDLTGAALTIKEGSITNKQMIIRLANETNEELTYGAFFAIEKYESGKWYTLPYVTEDWYWTLEGHGMEPNDTDEIKTVWKWAYGKLNKGDYRIVKPVHIGPQDKQSREANNNKDYYLTAEFEIK